MTYVLLMVLLLGGDKEVGGASLSHEFNSKAACERAATELQNARLKSWDNDKNIWIENAPEDSLKIYEQSYVCVPRG